MTDLTPPPAPTPPPATAPLDTSAQDTNPPVEILSAGKGAPLAILKLSIYQVFFPVSISKDGSNARNSYRCIKHILLILAKHCNGQLKVLPHNDHKSTNKDICLWSDFPSDADHAKLYLFNIQSPQQSFGKWAGQNF